MQSTGSPPSCTPDSGAKASSPRRLFLALSYTDPAGERRTLFSDAPRCASVDEVPAAAAPALALIHRERGTDITLQVADDVTAACLWRARIKQEGKTHDA